MRSTARRWKMIPFSSHLYLSSYLSYLLWIIELLNVDRISFVIKLILSIYFSIGLYFFSVMYDLMASSNLTPWPQKRLQCLVSSLFWMDKVIRWRNNSGKTSPWERMNENLHTWFAFFSLVKTNASTEHNRWKGWLYFDKMFFLR